MTHSAVERDADATAKSASAETEIARERTIGGIGTEVDDPIPIVDMRADQDTVDTRLWEAAADVGFFQVAHHGIAPELIDAAFDMSQAFFALGAEIKAKLALVPGTNSGWEFKSQRRPSTGTFDQKESYQITRSRMDARRLWPADDLLPGFRSTMEAFEDANRHLAMRLLSSFARRLGFDERFFTERHDPSKPTYQSTLRLLHYLPIDDPASVEGEWRAAAHTDFDCLTLLHQRPGQDGLQVSAGRTGEAGDMAWTSVPSTGDLVTCNVGDMLVRWSDDALRSTLHRVRMPRPGEHLGPRYSIGFFAQADTDAVIRGPFGRYEPITAGEYLLQRVTANAL